MAALVAFSVAGIVIGVLLFSLALAIGTAQQQLVSAMQMKTAKIKTWGGIVLLGVGVWFIALAIWTQEAFTRLFPG